MKIDNKSNEISILINKAVITKINIEFKEEELPEVNATVALLSVSGKKVTEVTFGTGWFGNKKMEVEEIPHELYSYIGVMVQKLMPALVRKINSIEKLLEAK